MGPVCTGLQCSSHSFDKLQLYIQIIKAQVFFSAGEMLCLLKIWLAYLWLSNNSFDYITALSVAC